MEIVSIVGEPGLIQITTKNGIYTYSMKRIETGPNIETRGVFSFSYHIPWQTALYREYKLKKEQIPEAAKAVRDMYRVVYKKLG